MLPAEVPAVDEYDEPLHTWLERLKRPDETDAAFLLRRFKALDTAPTLHKGICLAADRSGYVYAIKIKSGKLIYKLRIAPSEKRMVSYGKVESVWPVIGGVMVAEGKAYASAGRTQGSDGGLLIRAFEPETGKVIWSKCYSGSKSKSVFYYTAPDIFIQDSRPEFVFMGKVQLNSKTGVLLKTKGSKMGPALSGPSMDNWLAGGVIVVLSVAAIFAAGLSLGNRTDGRDADERAAEIAQHLAEGTAPAQALPHLLNAGRRAERW